MSRGPGGGGYGQNIAMFGSSNAKSVGSNKCVAQAITDMWYNSEVNQYPSSAYGRPSPDMSNFENWGHYSQLVWSSSSQVGCATQYCPPGTMFGSLGAWFTVCNYYPAGTSLSLGPAIFRDLVSEAQDPLTNNVASRRQHGRCVR